MEGWQGNYRDIDGALHQAMESQKIYSFFEKSAFFGEKRDFLVRFIQMAREWFEQWLAAHSDRNRRWRVQTPFYSGRPASALSRQ
jgi:hypothetical protein